MLTVGGMETPSSWSWRLGRTAAPSMPLGKPTRCPVQRLSLVWKCFPVTQLSDPAGRAALLSFPSRHCVLGHPLPSVPLLRCALRLGSLAQAALPSACATLPPGLLAPVARCPVGAWTTPWREEPWRPWALGRPPARTPERVLGPLPVATPHGHSFFIPGSLSSFSSICSLCL